jgi:hypothetical protein
MGNKNVKVSMSLETLEDIVFHACYRASRKVEQDLFKGLIPFLNKMNDDFETVIKEIDYIKLLLQERNITDYEENE